MSNPLDSDKSIDDGNKMPLPATLKGKQRAVELPTILRPDRRNPRLEQGNIQWLKKLSQCLHDLEYMLKKMSQ
jgi:hypothetical protein